jgi:hypothetical protein
MVSNALKSTALYFKQCSAYFLSVACVYVFKYTYSQQEAHQTRKSLLLRFSFGYITIAILLWLLMAGEGGEN